MTPRRILIAGIGNIFLGDDAFGVEVAQKLMLRSWPPDVRVVDFGIRSLDLTYALLDGCDVAILIDAVPRGEPPGTLFIVEPEAIAADQSPADDMTAGNLLMEGHSMDPAKVLRLVGALGGKVERILVIGCEPTPCESPEEMQMEMSPPVKRAVDEAVAMVEMTVARIRGGGYNAPRSANPAIQGDLDDGHSHTTA